MLKKETRIYERQLSDQLTSVRNSLLNGEMSTALFKVWVNEAAFHIQMLIHIVRLKEEDKKSVINVIDDYQKDFETLVHEFKLFKVKSFKISSFEVALV